MVRLVRLFPAYFSPITISRGEEYFYSGAVSILRQEPSRVIAEVVGSQTYLVSLVQHQPRGNLFAHCNCAHFSDGNFCKHLWAFFLLLDAEAHSVGVINRQSVRLLRGDEQRTSDRARQVKDVSAAPVTRPDWRQILPSGKPLSANSTKTRRKEIFFVLGASPSEKSSVELRFFQAELEDGGTSVLSMQPMILHSGRQISQADGHLQSLLSHLARLSSSSAASASFYGRYRNVEDSTIRTLDATLLQFLLPQLLATGRVYGTCDDFVASLNTGIPKNLKLAAWHALFLEVTPAPEGHVIRGRVLRKDQAPDGSSGPVPLEKLKPIAEPNLFKFENEIGFLDLNAEGHAWLDAFKVGPILVPSGDEEPFLEALLNQTFPYQLPTSLLWEQVQASPKAVIELTRDRKMAQDRFLVELKFIYGARRISYSYPEQLIPCGEEKKIYSRSKSEEELILLQSSISVLSSDRDGARFLVSKELYEFVQKSLVAGIAVTIENKKLETASEFKVSVSSGIDWFDVEAGVDFSGMWIKLPTILEAITRGETFVPLSNGAVGMVTPEIQRKLQKIAKFAFQQGDALQFGRSQALLLSSLLDGEPNCTFDRDFEKIRKKIKAFTGLAPSDPPRTFRGTLRSYQREGLGWFEFLESFQLGGILADDMGLGKTVQCLAFLEQRRVRLKNSGPALIVAPKSLLGNWSREAEKFTPEMRVLIHAGLDRGNLQKSILRKDLVVTTYQTLLRDLEEFAKIEWSSVVADEAQIIKNPSALVSKALKALMGSFRLAMSGTPIENSIEDLFSISDFVNPGFLNGKRPSASLKLDAETKTLLSNAFKPVMLRRTKDQVLQDLPPKTEQIINVDLDSKQEKIYKQMKRFYQHQILEMVTQEGVQKSQIHILAALTRLRQAALHPGLISPSHLSMKSAKFEVVLNMLDEIIAEGHRVLIFSQFTGLLGLLKTELEARKIAYSYLDGQTTQRDRVVGDFKKSTHPVFLISLKAGGVGLNLVEADYVFLLDPWWNPAVEAQAIDRVHRIGQSRPVNAYRFITKNTVEEKILELQNSKRGLSDDIFGEKSASLKDLSVSDIENLFA